MNVLIIEDDFAVAHYIESGLTRLSHTCKIANDGDQGLALAQSEKFDVLIVDRMLPALDGLSLVKSLRASNNLTPALILSALGEISYRVEGLKSGADDYLIKPFAFEELLARLEVLTRRSQPATHSDIILSAGDLVVDVLARKVTRAGKNISLQAREFKLLEYLLRHKNQIVTRTMLLEHVWEYHFDPQTNVIDVHISRLRQKIDVDAQQSLITTVRGSGYSIQTDA